MLTMHQHNYRPLSNEKRDRLMIVDPNRPDNNITGGSSEIPRIFTLFSQVYDQLQSRLEMFASEESVKTRFSFLEDIIGGNFSAYYEQRTALYKVYEHMYPKAGKNSVAALS